MLLLGLVPLASRFASPHLLLLWRGHTLGLRGHGLANQRPHGPPSGPRIFLRIAITSMTRPVRVRIGLTGLRTNSGKAFEMAADPFDEIGETRPHLLAPVERILPPNPSWTFPPASVTATELEVL